MSLTRPRRGIRGRGFVCAALVATVALLATAADAMAGVPTGETFTSAVLPKRTRRRSSATLHITTSTTYDDFTASPGEGDRFHARQEPEVREREPPLPNATWWPPTTAVQAACQPAS
jgi:hypothetical protein